jgi:hypothetical protein
VTQVYQGEDGRWWRYCLTCDDGSNKYGRHLRGHRTEADAHMSARDHARQVKKNRVERAAYAAWRAEVIAAPDWDTFSALWHRREPRIAITPETPERVELMREVQTRWMGEK